MHEEYHASLNPSKIDNAVVSFAPGRFPIAALQRAARDHLKPRGERDTTIALNSFVTWYFPRYVQTMFYGSKLFYY